MFSMVWGFVKDTGYSQATFDKDKMMFWAMEWNGETINWIWIYTDMAVCQNLVPLVNIKIAGKWMFIPLKMLLIGIDP